MNSFDFGSLLGSNSLLLIGAVVVGIYILVKITAKIVKTILMIAIAGLVYFFWQGGTVGDLKETALNKLFGKGSLADLTASYCQDEKAEKVKCMCIIEPISAELKASKSDEALRELDSSPGDRAAAISKAVKARKTEMELCLAKNKGKEYLVLLEQVWAKAQN